MLYRIPRIVAILVTLLMVNTAVEAARFEILYRFPANPYGAARILISDDGLNVIGDDGIYHQNGFVWSNSEVSLFADSLGLNGISGDGSTLVGSAAGSWPPRPTAISGGQRNTVGGNFYRGTAEDASFDGGVIVGAIARRNSTSRTHAFRWSNSTGVQSIAGQFPEIVEDNFSGSWANAVSHDGSTVVGAFNVDDVPYRQGSHGLIWAGDTLHIVSPFVEGGVIRFNDVSAHGKIVVGTGSHPGNFRRALVWSEEDGLQALEILAEPGYITHSAYAISSDGTTIVGKSGVAALWNNQGVHDLRAVLLNAGVDSVRNYILDYASDVSIDGRYIVGVGHDADRNYFAWRADMQVIPEPPAMGLFGFAAFLFFSSLYRRAE